MSVTMKSEFNCGNNKIEFNKINPTTKAPILYIFENNPILKINSLLRQLNPWNKRDKQSVANAKVAAKP